MARTLKQKADSRKIVDSILSGVELEDSIIPDWLNQRIDDAQIADMRQSIQDNMPADYLEWSDDFKKMSDTFKGTPEFLPKMKDFTNQYINKGLAMKSGDTTKGI